MRASRCKPFLLEGQLCATQNDNALTFSRQASDTPAARLRQHGGMSHFTHTRPFRLRRAASKALLALGALCCAVLVPAQDAPQSVPLISGGVGFFTNTNGGNPTYFQVLSPVLAAPIGSHLLVASRATLLETFFPKGGDQVGYTSSPFLCLNYLQGDYLV